MNPVKSVNVLPLENLNNSTSEINSTTNQNDDNQKITTKEMNNINSTMTAMINMIEDVKEIKNLTMNLPSSSDEKNVTAAATLSSPEVRGRALNFTNDINNTSFTASTEKPVNFVTNGPEIMTIFTNGGKVMVDLSDVSMDSDSDVDFKAVLNKNDSLINVKKATTTTTKPATLPECVMNGKIYKVRI